MRKLKKIKKKTRRKLTRLELYKQTCRKWLVIENDEYIDVIFGTIFANRLDSQPVWLHLVAPPGAGKTVMLQPLHGVKEIYSLSNLTPNTLISGQVRKKEYDDPSLIPKLDGKVLVIKDFTTILTKRSESLSEILGQLRDAYDGTCRKVFGTGKNKFYKSKFGVITAVTNEIDKHLGALSVLGERFLVYRLPEPTEREIRARIEKASTSGSSEQQTQELMQAAHHILSLDPPEPEFPDELRQHVEEIAMLVARARTSVSRDRANKEVQYPPQPEVATRLVKQLCDLGRGIAMAHESKVVTVKHVRLVQKVALDCLSANRLMLLRFLAEKHPDRVPIRSVANSCGISISTAKLRLNDLCLLKLAVKSWSEKPRFSYLCKLRRKYGVLLQEIWHIPPNKNLILPAKAKVKKRKKPV